LPALAIAILPPVDLFMVFQRPFIRGLTVRAIRR
jgi:ABC-type glycerol-3-phosphate transport system permease component